MQQESDVLRVTDWMIQLRLQRGTKQQTHHRIAVESRNVSEVKVVAAALAAADGRSFQINERRLQHLSAYRDDALSARVEPRDRETHRGESDPKRSTAL